MPSRSTSWSQRAEWKDGPAKESRAGDVGQVRAVELADGGDDAPAATSVSSVAVGERMRTCQAPASSSHARATTSVSQRTWGVTPWRSITSVEVALQLGLAGEELAPLVARLERVAVEVVADVDAAAGVGVLVPGAADAGVLLDDRERDARLLEPDAGEQARLAAADHDHGERRARAASSDAEVDLARVGAVELHLLEEHGHVLVRHVLRRRASSSSP